MKVTASKRDSYNALLEYRTTPISDCGKTHAQLLMNRRLRSILPTTPRSLQPAIGCGNVIVNGLVPREKTVAEDLRCMTLYDLYDSVYAPRLSLCSVLFLQNRYVSHVCTSI